MPTPPAMKTTIETLPDELLQLVLSFLSTPDLKNAALVSQSLHSHATDYLFRHVTLRDTWRLHLNDGTRYLWGERGQGECDEHDDTPIIQTLYLLARSPALASKVHVLTHRCHHPTPGIFSELPYVHFDDQNLSCSQNLRDLVRLAVQNLKNVHTLRIICGHRRLTGSLISAFLDSNRPYVVPVRRLWLESCSLMDVKIDDRSWPNTLESIRIRRLRAEDACPRDEEELPFPAYRVARGGQPFQLHDGAGGFYWSTVEFGHVDAPPHRPRITAADMWAKAIEFDEIIWGDLPHIVNFVNQNRHQMQRPQLGSGRLETGAIFRLLHASAALVKLNLDWVIWRSVGSEADDLARDFMNQLSKQRFPNLRAFQVRNAVVPMTMLPHDIYLFDSPFLEFIETHPKLECLAFPLNRFYSSTTSSPGMASRTRRVVAHLAATLVDLRIDMFYNTTVDPITDEGGAGLSAEQERICRRRFISEFAPHMTKIEQIKLEGGIPRDEKREILRALHQCPLKKIVIIGASFPGGNTWGHRGEALMDLDEGNTDPPDDLEEEEDMEAIEDAISSSPSTEESFEFTPSYGWPRGAPFLHTIAAHHASTVEELKLCGFNGAPVLSHFLPITRPLLYPLVHFHNLKHLIISFYLLTYFEEDYRDGEIIQSWMDTRSPSSTALVVVTPPATPTPSPPSVTVTPTIAPDFPNPAARPQDFNRWAVALKTRFTPSALAYRVAADIAPFLSPQAKERKGGVRVRASFALGKRSPSRSANDIFDLDVVIGKGDCVMEFVGPREEGEKGRWWEKLDGRRWF
ncbi:hypothetical protein K491DRAFT_705167 [Lophiostoma macrostomum CBS 122681]|uniref:F-box domain-containing protein n=1 Tax=Lophiostoma macrostomum CBS 122681 TaxID=1314788 RepID=A0A6A6T3D3_9PLEO|nr:hypothetical protein K491DRAFT_705167 [Lophiostoma macrostomum CBS 122681]